MQTDNNTNTGPLGPVGPVGPEEKRVYLCEKCGEYHTDDENEDDIFDTNQQNMVESTEKEKEPVQEKVIISVVTSEDQREDPQDYDQREDDTECNLTEEVSNPEQMIKDLNLSDH